MHLPVYLLLSTMLVTQWALSIWQFMLLQLWETFVCISVMISSLMFSPFSLSGTPI